MTTTDHEARERDLLALQAAVMGLSTDEVMSAHAADMSLTRYAALRNAPRTSSGSITVEDALAAIRKAA